MFDDVQKKSNQGTPGAPPPVGQPNAGQPAPTSAPPTNLPGATPSQPQQPPQQSQPQKQEPKGAEDMFAGTDIGTPPPPPPAFKPIAPSGTSGLSAQDLGELKGGSKKGPIIAIIVVVILVLAAAGWAGWFFFMRGGPIGEPANEDFKEVTVDNGAVVTEPVGEPVVEPTNEPVVEPTDEPAGTVISKDSDQDGLTDEEEVFYGTDIDLADTDGDELSDRDELKVWQTDPLNADSDADGYADGHEIKNGYNPKGAGLLINLP